MFTLGNELQFQLYTEPTDMRKSFDGLCGIIQNQLNASPTDGSVYLFINKNRTKIKLLYWSGNSFTLYYKRLESGTFESFNYDTDQDSLQLTYAQIVLLIDGISIKNLEQRRRYIPDKQRD